MIPVGQILVVYQSGNADSLSCAQYYQSLHHLGDDQLVGIPCSGLEILPDYAAFQTQVETHVKTALTDASIQAIVIVNGVPGGFQDGTDVISTTSRLSRINSTYSKNYPNPLYNRSDLTGMGPNEYAQAIVCSRIDSPSLGASQQLIDSARFVLSQGVANGTFFIDPYPPNDETYADELAEFVQRTLPLLNLDVYTTEVAEPYQDLFLPYVENDSFLWSCGGGTSDSSFFELSASARIFLYNADTNSAVTVRDANGNRWPYLAITNGYASTAGSMSFSDPSHYLNPRPLFNALMAGSPIGEAYLLSVQYLDSPETLFGDPLVATAFPAGLQPPVLLSTAQATEQILYNLAQAAACIYRKQVIISDIMQLIVNTQDIPTMINTLYKANDVNNSLTDSYITDFGRMVVPAISLVGSISGTPTSNTDLNNFLATNYTTIPQVLADVFTGQGITINAANLTTEGDWYVQFPLQNLVPSLADLYQFELQLATDPYFQTIVLVEDSAADPFNWFYQTEVDDFAEVPSNGVPSNFVGRLIRYVGAGSEQLPRGNGYYVRFRQKVETTTFAYVTGRLVIAS